MSSALSLAELEVREVDHLGVVAELWDELGFDGVINAAMAVDEQVKVRPATALKALCLNLVHGRDALYRVQSFFATVPTELLLGGDVTAEMLNDDALGRHLDRLFEAGGAQLFNALSLKVIGSEGLRLEELHGDTTSKLVFGEYAQGHEDAISVTYGHSKDHRPDLKQVMAALTTTKEGVPVLAEMLSGNQSDKTWYGTALEKVRERLRLPTGHRVHLVGDSALITQDNLDTAARCGIEITGRLPRTVKACSELVAEAVARDQWKELGALSETPGAAEYEGQWFESTILGHRLQGAVYRSSHPNSRADESVRRRQRRDCEEARREAKLLMKESYACEADAEQAKKHFLSEHEGQALRITGEVVHRKVVGRYARRGRPAAGATPPTSEQIGLQLAVEVDATEAERAAADESCFVLVHLGEERLSAAEMLRAYKAQAMVETRFPFLKDTNWADTFFVKQPQRVEALGYVMLISLLLWSVWERRIRRALAASGEPPLKDVTGMAKKRPTAAVCAHIMKGIRVARSAPDHPWQRLGRLTPEQARVARFSATRIN
jgi:transposase